jgi:hypothetical protein
VTFEEVRNAIDDTLSRMKRNKSCAEDGLVAEMLQTKHEPLLQAIACMFVDILNGTAGIPSVWSRTKLVVLTKKGDVTLPNNYRPIAIIPILCKVFSGVLLRRMEDIVSSGFSLDLQLQRSSAFPPHDI